MTRREVAFLLIELGVGLILAVVAIVEFILWFHRMFIVGIRLSWSPGSIVLALPFILMLIGSMLLFPGKGEQRPG